MPSSRGQRILFDALIIVCLTYPTYAIAPGNDHIAFCSNVGVVVLGAATAMVVQVADRVSAAIAVAMCVWVSYAALATAQGLGWL